MTQLRLFMTLLEKTTLVQQPTAAMDPNCPDCSNSPESLNLDIAVVGAEPGVSLCTLAVPSAQWCCEQCKTQPEVTL